MFRLCLWDTVCDTLLLSAPLLLSVCGVEINRSAVLVAAFLQTSQMQPFVFQLVGRRLLWGGLFQVWSCVTGTSHSIARMSLWPQSPPFSSLKHSVDTGKCPVCSNPPFGSGARLFHWLFNCSGPKAQGLGWASVHVCTCVTHQMGMLGFVSAALPSVPRVCAHMCVCAV